MNTITSVQDYGENEISPEVCRLCLSNCQILKSMIHCSISNQSYATIYNTITGFIIKEKQDLPQKICSECESTLISFHNFRERIEIIEHRLRVYESRLETQIIEVASEELDDSINCEIECDDNEMLIEAIEEEEFIIRNEDSISCDAFETVHYEQLEACYFTPDSTNRKAVSCKLHEICELAATINNAKVDETIAVKCYCSAVLKNRRSFLKHYSTIHTTKSTSIKCKVCSESFITWRSKMCHEANAHNIGIKFECSVCSKKFYRSDHWKEHEKTCNRTINFDKFFACSVCLFTFQREETYKKHLETAHVGANDGDTEYLKRAEEYAQKYSKRKDESPNESQEISKDTPKCNICNKTFKNEVSLGKHTNLFHANHCWPCEKCDAVFTHRSTKISHMSKEHGAKKTFQCSDCDFSCFKRDRYYAHMDKHVNPEKKFPCPICQQEFKSYNTMTLHRARHLKKNTFVCPTCNKQFLEKRNYNVHLKLHTGEDLHHCPICDRGFNRKDHLQKHQERKKHFVSEEVPANE